MSNFFHTIFYIPIDKSLMFFYQLVDGNLGIAIIILTLVVRLILIPLTIPTLKSAQKMKDIKPEIDDIKKKYKNNPQKLQAEQLAIYKKHGINPAAGCLPILIQLPILIYFYRVLLDILKSGAVNSQFLFFDLSQPDKYYVLPILSALLQFAISYMSSSGKENKEIKQEKKEGDFADSLTGALQTQNLYIMPLLWFFMLLKLPSGIGIYWVMSTLFSLVQQFVFVGPGRFKNLFSKAK